MKSKEERRKQFYENLRRGSTDIEADYVRACFCLERDLGVEITQDYPDSKFTIQLQEWIKDMEQAQRERKKQSGKQKFGDRTFGG